MKPWIRKYQLRILPLCDWIWANIPHDQLYNTESLAKIQEYAREKHLPSSYAIKARNRVYRRMKIEAGH